MQFNLKPLSADNARATTCLTRYTDNAVFGAGRSGTTGELLKTYRTFGSTAVDETFKQYLFASVVYLVGGGHHTCHEIFSVANLLTPGGGPKEPNAKLSCIPSLGVCAGQVRAAPAGFVPDDESFPGAAREVLGYRDAGTSARDFSLRSFCHQRKLVSCPGDFVMSDSMTRIGVGPAKRLG